MLSILFVKVPLLQWLWLWSRSVKLVIPVLELSGVALLYSACYVFLASSPFLLVFIILFLFLVMLIKELSGTALL